MKVVLVAQTEISVAALREMGYVPHEWPELISAADELTEATGRLCYKKFKRERPSTATSQGYLAHIIESKHFSIMRHASASFWISGISRDLLQELARHGFIDPSVVSQRYVNHTGVPVVYPPAIVPFLDETLWAGNQDRWTIKDEIDAQWENSQEAYGNLIKRFQELGLKRKEAYGAARTVLPGGTETEGVFTSNHQGWREFIQKRNSEYADQEIRELAQELLKQLKEIAPNCYQDLEV